MTRLAVLADIHGNLPALEAVMADFARFKVDQVVVAGDVINWGPFSAQVLERITREGWMVVRGNNELYLLDYQTPRARPEWNDSSLFPVLPWLHRQLDGQWKKVISAWPENLVLNFPDARALRIFHGSPRSSWEPISPITPHGEVEGMFAGVEERHSIAGHTHLAMDRQVGHWQIFNPGSVGVPLDGEFTAGYMLLEAESSGWRASFRRVPFDYAPIFREFERLRLVEECGIIGHFILDEFKTARVRLSPFLRWRQACCPGAPLTLDLLDRYADVNPLEYTPEHYRVNMIA